MDVLTVSVMIILFIILMAFIFSTALLTPMIGKKNLLFVVSMGFIVGIVGGAFFISPIYNDIPDMARFIFESTGTGEETINIEVSTNTNITNLLNDIRNIPGVKRVDSKNLNIKTAQFTEDYKPYFEDRIPVAIPETKSVQVIPPDTIIIELKEGSDPQTVLTNLKDWLMLVSGIELTFSIVQASVIVEPSMVGEVTSQLPMDEVVITSITGPTEENVQSLQKMLPSQSTLILYCGFLGVIIGLIGLFIDRIISFLKNIREHLLRRRIKREL